MKKRCENLIIIDPLLFRIVQFPYDQTFDKRIDEILKEKGILKRRLISRFFSIIPPHPKRKKRLPQFLLLHKDLILPIKPNLLFKIFLDIFTPINNNKKISPKIQVVLLQIKHLLLLSIPLVFLLQVCYKFR